MHNYIYIYIYTHICSGLLPRTTFAMTIAIAIAFTSTTH